MRSKVVLLIVPPLLALALLWFSKNNEEPSNLITHDTEVLSTEQTKLTKALPTIDKQPVVNTQPTSATNENANGNPKPSSAIEQIQAIKNKTALHQAVLKEHEQFTRYPSKNKRFDRPEQDPVSMMYETHERSSTSEDKRDIITVWSDKKYILKGDEITFYARVDTPEQRGIPTKFLSQLHFGEQYSVGTYALGDEDGDGIFSYTLQAEQTGPLSEGIYKLIIVSKHKDLAEAVSFVVSPPLIKTTGEYRDSVQSGDLLIETQVQVQEEARYYIRASIYDIADQAIGSTEFATELTPGLHWIPLSFFGLMLHDHGEAGPYKLKNIELAKAGIPMLRMPLTQTEFMTDSYPLDYFSAKTHTDSKSLN